MGRIICVALKGELNCDLEDGTLWEDATYGMLGIEDAICMINCVAR